LKHDLALQRLLKESHLLDAESLSNQAMVPEGKARLKAIDLRIRDLGAKKSALAQEKMPMAQRKGMAAKAAAREASRRKEALESGVILEKAKVTFKPRERRQRGIDAPSIGKFKGGTLRLNSRDVRSIEGSKKSFGGQGRKRR
jgi:hypothetical protein